MTTAQTPDWVKHAVFYQIFPDRFARSERLPKPAHVEPWETPPTEHGYKGGDLLGVVEHLDDLCDLGITALYFCPIFASTSNHRYNTHDYLQVDPMLGGNTAFRTLLDEAHRAGIRIVIDGVFNHTARSFLPFADILENGEASPYRDWYRILKWPPNAYDTSHPPDYWAWWNLHHMPTLNHDNPEVQAYIYHVARYWIDAGADGWRLDVPFEIKTPGFWQRFRQVVKAANPEAYIVGEVWTEAQEWLQGDQFDAVMNYLYATWGIRYAIGEHVNHDAVFDRRPPVDEPITAGEYADRIDDLLALYPWDIQCAQLNLLDSHDTARLLTVAGGDVRRVKLAALLQFTFPGAPCIYYYGSEIGMEGGRPDRAAHASFPWDRPHLWNRDLRDFYTQLISMCKSHSALRTGAYHHLYADDDVYVFARCQGHETALVAVNRADVARRVTVPVGALCGGAYTVLTRIYGGGGVNVLQDGYLDVMLPPCDGIVWYTS